MSTTSVPSDYVVPPVGGMGTCRACGKRGPRRQNLPDDPADRRPDVLACSAACAKRIMEREFGEWRCMGWLK